MATKKSTKQRSEAQETKVKEDELEALFQRMKDEAPVLPKGFVFEVDEKLKKDATRRAALRFLEMPFREMVDAFENDRDTAVAFADLARTVPEAIERYKGLAKLLETAQIRIEMALCVREDLPAIRKEVALG